MKHEKIMIDDDSKKSCHRNGSVQQLGTLQLSLNSDYSFKDNGTKFVSRTHKFSDRCIILDSSKLANAQK